MLIQSPKQGLARAAISLLLCIAIALSFIPIGQISTAQAVDGPANSGPYGGRLISEFPEKYGEDLPDNIRIAQQGNFLWQYFEETKTARVIAYIGAETEFAVPFQIFGTGQQRSRTYSYNGYSATITDTGGVKGETYDVIDITSFRIMEGENATLFGTFDAGCGGGENNALIRTVVFPQNFRALSCERMFAEAKSLRAVYNYPVLCDGAFDYAFYNCESLRKAPVIPEGATDISYAFAGCTTIEQAPEIHDGVTTMAGAFEGCTNLKAAPSPIPDSVVSMVGTFRNCIHMETAPQAIPHNVRDMTECFMNCTSLVEPPALEDGIQIMDGAFYNCSSMIRLPNEPNSVQSDVKAFYGCTSAGTVFTITYEDRGQVLQSTREKIGSPTPDCPRPVRSGYIFDGWSPSVDTLVMGDATYTAIWRGENEERPRQCTIAFYANDALIYQVSALEGTPMPECPILPYKPGHILKGWTPEAPAVVTGDMNFYAEWEAAVKYYTITYYDRNTVLFTQKVAYGRATPDCPTIPERAGYRFDGWDPQVEPIVMGTANYTAKWAELPEGTKYKVQYMSEGNVIYEQEVLDGEQTPVCPIVPQRDGWAFAGWSPEIAPTVEAPAIYYAQWNPISTMHRVRYLDRNVLVFQQDVEEGFATPACPYELTREGYYFAGWDPEWSETVTEDVDYHAVWYEKIDSFNISYFDRGSLVFQRAARKGEETPKCPELLSRPGYVFCGWTPEVEPTVYADMEYQAVWRLLQGSFKWTYDANDGTGNIVDEQEFNPDEAGTVTTTVPSRDGYVFLGWSQSAMASEPQFTPGQEIIADGSKMLFAVWEPGQYTIKYNGNGHTSGMMPSTQTVSSEDTVKIADDGLFQKDACEFLGWATAPLAKDADPAYAPGAEIHLTHHVTLYAIWKEVEPYYIITYDGNGQTEGQPPSQQQVIKGQNAVVKDASSLAKDGFTFEGWSLNPDAFKEDMEYYPINRSINVQHSLTLYAVWKPLPGPEKFTLSYNANRGSGTVPGASVGYSGTSVIVAEPNYLTRDGYRFAGWSEDPYAYRPDFKYTPNNPIDLIRDIRLYAVWVPSALTLSYDGNGATNGFPPRSEERDRGEGVTVQGPQTLTRPGYYFIGWSENPYAKEGDELLQEGKTFPLEHDTTLYAIWASDPYSTQYNVTFSANGGSGTVPASQTVLPGTIITFPNGEGLSRPGYKFIGWSGDPDAKPSHVLNAAGSQIRINENMTFFAVWQPTQGGDPQPSTSPSTKPSSNPSTKPSTSPSTRPSTSPSTKPSTKPSTNPSTNPSTKPSTSPSSNPSTSPSTNPSASPSSNPSTSPSSNPSTRPSTTPPVSSPTTIPSQTQPTNPWQTVSPNPSHSANPSGGIETETCSVTYAANGGNGAPPTQSGLAGSNTIVAWTRPTRDAWTFLGWSTDKDAKEADPQYAPGETFRLAQSITLYAVWGQYVMTYDANYAGAPAATTAIGGMLDIAVGPKRDGYAFEGWSDEKSGPAQPYYTPGTRFLMTKNITLYAQWKEQTSPTPAEDRHTVSYSWTVGGVDGTQANLPSTIKFPAAEQYKEGDQVRLDTTYAQGTTMSARYGTATTTYVFSGWNLPAGLKATDGKFTMPAKDVNITGAWTAATTTPDNEAGTYTIRHEYYTNGALDGTTSAVRSAKYGDTIKLSNVAQTQIYKGNTYTLASITPNGVMTLTKGAVNTFVLRYERTAQTPVPSPSPSGSATQPPAPSENTGQPTVTPSMTPSASPSTSPSTAPSASPSATATPSGTPQGTPTPPRVIPGISTSSPSPVPSTSAKPSASATMTAPLPTGSATIAPATNTGNGSGSTTGTRIPEANKNPDKEPEADKGPYSAKTDDPTAAGIWICVACAAGAALLFGIWHARRKKQNS